MSAAEKMLLVQAISAPASMRGFSAGQWSSVVAQGQACSLLAKLGPLARSQSGGSPLPAAVARHVESAEIVFRRQQHNVLYEVENLSAVLGALGCPVLVLKGAAYIAAGLPAGQGRLVSDIDLMVPREFIGRAESELMLNGWVITERDPYNQRYYREWMHEIPPMRNIRTGTVVDLHHTILPLTASPRLDASKLFAASLPLAGFDGLRTLSPLDMILHSATHLFHEGELDRGLRDLVDLDTLICAFRAQNAQFWPQLAERAKELDLERDLFYALRYVNKLLATDVPDTAFAALSAGAPGLVGRAMMDWLFLTALRPNHPTCDLRSTALARFCVYIRGHWLRMPPHLLVIHLARKWRMRHGEASKKE